MAVVAQAKVVPLLQFELLCRRATCRSPRGTRRTCRACPSSSATSKCTACSAKPLFLISVAGFCFISSWHGVQFFSMSSARCARSGGGTSGTWTAVRVADVAVLGASCPARASGPSSQPTGCGMTVLWHRLHDGSVVARAARTLAGEVLAAVLVPPRRLLVIVGDDRLARSVRAHLLAAMAADAELGRVAHRAVRRGPRSTSCRARP